MNDPFKNIDDRFNILEAQFQKLFKILGGATKPAVMTTKMICDEFHISKGTVYNARKKGMLTPDKFGSLVRFKRSEVEDWIRGR